MNSHDVLMQLVANTEKVSDYLQTDVNWHEILFSDWEMTPFQELYFENLCKKEPQFADAVTNDVTEELVNYFKYRITKRANVNLILVGEQGSGKSTLMFKLYLLWVKYLQELLGEVAPEPIRTWKCSETLDAYVAAVFKQLILQDEDDDIIGVESRNLIKKLGNLIKRARFTGIGLFISCPVLVTIPGCDYALLPFGFYKPGSKKYDETGDASECAMRALLYVKSKMHRDKYDLQGCVFLWTADAIKYMVKTGYGSDKKESWEKIKNNLGSAGAKTEEQVKREKTLAVAVYKHAIANGWNGTSKKALNPFIDDVPECRALSDNDRNNLKERVCTIFEKAKKKRVKVEDKAQPNYVAPVSTTFTRDIPSLLEFLKQREDPNWKNKDADLEIFVKMLEAPMLTNDQLAEAFSKYDYDQSNFTKIRQRVWGYIADLSSPDYEKFRLGELTTDPQWKSVTRLGGESEPDIICVAETFTMFVNAKCYHFTRKSYPIPIRKFQAEILAAQEILKHGGDGRARGDIFNLAENKTYLRDFTRDEILNYKKGQTGYILLNRAGN